MKDDKMKHIDFSRSRLGRIADKYYNAGDYVLALRFAYAELEECGGDGEVYARLADIYESMGLHGSAINWLYRYLDIAEDEELPDVYEAVKATYVFAPTCVERLTSGNDANDKVYANTMNIVRKYALREFFSGDSGKTVGIAYRDGKVVVVLEPTT